MEKELIPVAVVTQAAQEAWVAALKHDSFDMDDDFFAVGGDSMLAAQVTARLSKLYAVRLPMRLLFVSPTIRSFGQAVAERVKAR